MFGMGFTEIIIIAVIAILFLGPDKLPSTMIEIAKFFRNAKNAIGSVKDTLEEEMHVSEIKQEALAYKKQLLDASEKIEKVTDVKSAINAQVDDILNDDEPMTASEPEKKAEEVTFKKKKKKKKKSDDEEEIIDV